MLVPIWVWGTTSAAAVRSDVVLRWNQALTTHAASAGDVQPESGATAFLLAIVHGAMRDGIEAAIDEKESHTSDTFPAAVGAATAHATLSTLLADQGATWDRLLAESLAPLPDETTRHHALMLGRHIASLWLERHGYAGAAAAASLGVSEPTPQWIYSAQPFVLKQADQIRVASPDLSAVVREKIRAQRRSVVAESPPPSMADPKAEYRFWAGSAEGIWNGVARKWSATHSTDVLQQARLFGVLNAAMADGYIAAYESRRQFRSGRWFFLMGQAAEAFGATNSPARIRIHASVEKYPSVPAVISGTAAEILQTFCGGDAQPVTIESGAQSALPARDYTCISQAAKACALAAGLTDPDLFKAGPAGFQQGRKIGRWIAQQTNGQ